MKQSFSYSEERRVKIGNALRGVPKTEEHKKAIAAGVLEKSKDLKYIAQLSSSREALWKDPEYRNKQVQAHTGFKNKEETKVKKAEALKLKWRDPVYRAKQLESRRHKKEVIV
jgi:hypothetical protein